MQIVTYTNTRAPAGYQALALIFTAGKNAKGGATLEALPVRITGATAEEARARAQAFWEHALEHYASRRGQGAKAGRQKTHRLDGHVDPETIHES